MMIYWCLAKYIGQFVWLVGVKICWYTMRIWSYVLQFLELGLTFWLKSCLRLPGKPFLTLSVPLWPAHTCAKKTPRNLGLAATRPNKSFLPAAGGTQLHAHAGRAGNLDQGPINFNLKLVRVPVRPITIISMRPHYM